MGEEPFSIPDEDLYTYAIARDDLQMPAGKLASQAMHAGRLSLLKYLQANPSHFATFLRDGHVGSAVVLRAKNLAQLEATQAAAEALGLPCALFEDSGHILPPHFTGAPVKTVLAIGPAPRAQMREITRRFQCA